MRKFFLVVLFLLFAFPAYALELLMAHNPACGICQRFIEEVAPNYNDSITGYKLPLVIIPVNKQPLWFKEAYKEKRIKLIRGTPTFIVWNGRKEIGRLVGYYNKESFYERLRVMFKN
jgi:thioredoxin-related protein